MTTVVGRRFWLLSCSSAQKRSSLPIDETAEMASQRSVLSRLPGGLSAFLCLLLLGWRLSGSSQLPVGRTVFPPKNPILAFDVHDETEQEGMMHLFEGSVTHGGTISLKIRQNGHLNTYPLLVCWRILCKQQARETRLKDSRSQVMIEENHRHG